MFLQFCRLYHVKCIWRNDTVTLSRLQVHEYMRPRVCKKTHEKTIKLCCVSGIQKNIAFTVSLTGYVSPWTNKKIIYDKVITNIGDGYSPSSGVFTSPSDGDYVFTWSTMNSGDTTDCSAYIYKNGVKLLLTYAVERGGSYNEVASNTAVFHLSVGDTVWIQTSSCGSFAGYPYTAFSGWKLWTYILMVISTYGIVFLSSLWTCMCSKYYLNSGSIYRSTPTTFSLFEDTKMKTIWLWLIWLN